jgi:hypothetical protein
MDRYLDGLPNPRMRCRKARDEPLKLGDTVRGRTPLPIAIDDPRLHLFGRFEIALSPPRSDRPRARRPGSASQRWRSPAMRAGTCSSNHSEQPMSHLDSEAIDFRVASESFSSHRTLRRRDLERQLRLVTNVLMPTTTIRGRGPHRPLWQPARLGDPRTVHKGREDRRSHAQIGCPAR